MGKGTEPFMNNRLYESPMRWTSPSSPALSCHNTQHSTAPRKDPRCSQVRGLLHCDWTNNSPPPEHPTPPMPTDPIPIPQGQLPGPDSRNAMLYIWTKIRNNYFIKEEKEMATHSRILAWRIPWTEEPGRLQSMESRRVRHDWATNTHTHTLHQRGQRDGKQLKRCWMSLAIRERQIKAMMRYQHTPSRMGTIRILPIPSAAKNAERLYFCTSPAESQNDSATLETC